MRFPRATHLVMGFAEKADAEEMLEALKARFAQYGLQVHPQKTQLVRFKRPQRDPNRRGPKPETFDFLGFTYYWGKSQKGNQVFKSKTSSKRLRRTLKQLKEWGWKNRNLSLKEQQEQINRKLQGHYSYYGISSNSASLGQVFYQVRHLWRKWLGRRNRNGPMSWEKFSQLLVNYPLIQLRIVHSYF